MNMNTFNKIQFPKNMVIQEKLVESTRSLGNVFDHQYQTFHEASISQSFECTYTKKNDVVLV